jgi:hypothetical protein
LNSLSLAFLCALCASAVRLFCLDANDGNAPQPLAPARSIRGACSLSANNGGSSHRPAAVIEPA